MVQYSEFWIYIDHPAFFLSSCVNLGEFLNFPESHL